MGQHPPLIEAYERHLASSRGLSLLTVRNYVADAVPFLEYLERQGAGPNADASGLRDFVSRLGEEHVAREYRSLVRDYVAWLLERRTLSAGRRAGARGHGRASVVRCLVALRSFMRYLIGEGLVPDAPLWAPRSTLMRRFTPRAARRLPDIVAAAEAVRLVEAPAAGDGPGVHRDDAKSTAMRLRDTALLELLYGGGVRVSELTGMDVRDLPSDARHARVLGKGSKARQVPLGAPAASALRRYIEDGRPRLVGPVAGGALFLNHRGSRLSVRAVQGLVRRYAAAAGLRDGVHPHTLRHSYATHLLDGGADLRVVQELLGHSTPSATQVYTHVSQQEARRVYLGAHPLAREGAGPTPSGG